MSDDHAVDVDEKDSTELPRPRLSLDGVL